MVVCFANYRIVCILSSESNIAINYLDNNKRMKRKVWTLLAAVLVVAGAMAVGAKAQTTQTISLNGSPVRLQVSHSIEVKIIPSTKNEMVVEEEGKGGTFKYTFENGKLTLSREKKSRRRWFNFGEDDIDVKLYVTDVTKLEEVSASGASEVDIKQSHALNIRKVDLSGASSFEAQGSLRSTSVILSGASEFDFDGSIQQLSIDGSGASSVEVDGDISGRLSVDLSGASSMEYKGHVKEARIEVSGASGFKGKRASADTAWLEASGASKIILPTNEVKSSSTSGMSSINS